MERGSREELAEFAELSAKVAAKAASPEERERWRVLRGRLAGPPPLPPQSLRSAAPVRAHARQAIEGSRKLRIGFAQAKELHITFADEIGAGGLRVTVHELLEVGAPLLLRLEVGGPTDPEPLVTLGRVIRCRREGGHFLCGLELPGLRPEERERLEAYAHAGRG